MIRRVSDGRNSIEYTLMRTHRTDVLLKVLPGDGVRVYVPQGIRLRDADEIVRARIVELTQMQNRLEHALQENRLAHPVAPGSRICIEGTPYLLQLRAGEKTSLQLGDDACTLTLRDPADEESVRAALRQTLSRRALLRIRTRLETYAPRIGVTFGRVAIRDQRSRWGSCSAQHNLNFNWKLIMAPPEVLDYVVIHELCHLIEFNHSPRFWQLVEAQMPEYACWKKWLKAHGSELGVGS